MNILLTGANGQLGQHLALLAPQSQHNYILTDVDTLDITRRDAVLNYVLTSNISLVINCAAYTNVEQAEDDEETAERVNAVAVSHLADAMKVVGGTLIHISTDYVFGGNAFNSPIPDEAPYNPTSAYGRTKMHGEQAIANVGCRHLIFRTGWLYSEYGKNFVKTMRRVIDRGPCTVVCDQVGTPTYAGDLARLIFDIVENDDFRSRYGIYNFSDEGVCSWYDFAIEIARLSSLSNPIRPCLSSQYPSRVVRPSYAVLDKSKVKETFGITIPHWTTSLALCVGNLERSESQENTN